MWSSIESKSWPIFYTSMGYPTPHNDYYYYHISETIPKETNTQTRQELSWDTINPATWAALLKLQKEINFLTHIPFVSQIYLCNSITFNAMNDRSDIDIFIISKPHYLWFARLWSWLFFVYKGLKRSSWHGDHSGKFCLSFYVDGDHTDLISIRRPQGDVYLSYWIAHNILRYTDETYPDDHLWKQNSKLLDYLPHHPHHQTINLGLTPIRWSSTIKQWIEKILSTWRGRKIQQMIAYLRWIVLKYKISQLPSHQQTHIIVSPTILKFHNDKRDYYQTKRKNSHQKRNSKW